jgi:hypothetical protein
MEKICLKCYDEYVAPIYGKYVVCQSPMYMKALISKHPFYVHLLYFLNIGLHIQNQNWGFIIGETMDISLLNSSLLSWDGILDKNISNEKNSSIFLPILNYNIINKKWYKQ